MKQIDECHQILADPYGYAERFKAESGQKIVGTFCSYAPEEIIIAAGAHPFRIFGTGEKIRLAEAHLQSYCCSLVRGALEDALGGASPSSTASSFPIPATRSSGSRTSGASMSAHCFHLDLVLPVKLDTESARHYLVDVLNRFREELGGKLGVTITDEDLRAAIALTNRIRGALTRIAELAGDRPGILKGSDLSALVRAAMIMDRSRAATLLEEVADRARTDAGRPEPVRSGNGSSSRAASATSRTSTRSSRRREGRWSGTTSAPVPGPSAA